MCGWCLPQLSPLPSNVSNLFNKLKSFSKADSHRERGETSVQTLLFRFLQWGCTYDLEEQGRRGCRRPCPVPQMVTALCYSQRTMVQFVQFGCLDVLSNDLVQQLPNSKSVQLNFSLLSKVNPGGPLQG